MDTTGFLGNLTPDQEVKLQQLWTILLQASDARPSNGSDEQSPPQPQHRRQLSTLSRAESKVSVASSTTGNYSHMTSTLQGMGMSASDIKSIQKSLSHISPDELLLGLLSTARADHPDGMLLRFLRARKWDVAKAFGMMVDAIVWRMKEMHVDDDVLAKGELYALQQSQSSAASAAEKKDASDFLAQFRMGKSYLHGTDRAGRPIVVVRVRIHKPSAQTEQTMERYIVHVIESVRLVLQAPVETATILFDLTDFGLSNMDYAAVKFIVKSFEANYPETLGSLIIHKAPWVFSGIWKIIRGWMDPVIVSKVHFTRNVDELEQLIAHDQLPREVSGDGDGEYTYIEPDPNENKRIEDTITRDALMGARQQIGEALLVATSAWIEASSAKEKDEAEIARCKAQRDAVMEQLRIAYWKLDPYLRPRTILDRKGLVKGGADVLGQTETEKPVNDVELQKTLVEHVERTEVTVVQN